MYGNSNLDGALRILCGDNSPEQFYEFSLKSMQLLFDGLVEKKPENLERQNEIFDGVFNSLKIGISQHFRSESIDYEKCLEFISENKSDIIKYGSEKISKKRHLSKFKFIVRTSLDQILPALNDIEIDTLVPIASGGFEPCAIIADYLDRNNRTYETLPVRYSRLSKLDKYVLAPHFLGDSKIKESIRDKNVLIVEEDRKSVV